MPKVLENIQLGCGACRIGLRRCWQWLKCYRPIVIIRDQYKVLCIGLTGAGKSTVLATLVGESIEDTEPTTGFNIKTLPLKDTLLDIKELGGGEHIRPFWNRYFQDQHGILYVIDASCGDDELNNTTNELQAALSNNALKNIPCIILATHCDVDESRTQQQIEDHFHKILHGRKWQVHMCGLGDRNSIIICLEHLVDLMAGID